MGVNIAQSHKAGGGYGDGCNGERRKERLRIAYEIDDCVVHPQHGIGRVVKIEFRQFGSGTAQLYYEISIPDGTIWVQVEGSPCGLRKITAKTDLVKYRDVLKSRPTPLTANHLRLTLLTQRTSTGLSRSYTFQSLECQGAISDQTDQRLRIKS